METILMLYYLAIFIVTGVLLATKYRASHNGFIKLTEGEWRWKWHRNYVARPAWIGSCFIIGLAGLFYEKGIVTAILAPFYAGGVVLGIEFIFKLFGVFGMRFNPIRDKDSHNRGARIANVKTVNQRIAKAKLATRLSLGGLSIPQEIEGRNFVFAGSPGSGKTQGIMTMLDQLSHYPDRAFIADPSGQFYKRYLQPDSVLFNPFDSRSVDWSPLAEMDGVWSAQAIACSIIPDGEGSEAAWNKYAQTVLTVILQHVYQTDGDNGDLYRICCVAGFDEMQALTKGTPAGRFFEKEGSDMTNSTMNILTTFIGSFQYLNPETGKEGFSFAKYAREGESWVFLTYEQTQLKLIKPLIACALDTVSLAILGLQPDLNRQKIWIVSDEFPLLGRIQNLEILATNGRKHGSVIMLGFQDQGQIEASYGKLGSGTLLNCIGTQCILRCTDQKTASYWAEHAGKQEITRTNQSGGVSGGQGGTNSGWSQQVTQEHVYMPSEIQNFQDLNGFVNLAGDYPLVPVWLSVAKQQEDRCVAFVQKDFKAPVKVVKKEVDPVEAMTEPVEIDL